MIRAQSETESRINPTSSNVTRTEVACREEELHQQGGRSWRGEIEISTQSGHFCPFARREECAGPTATQKCRPAFPYNFEDMHLNWCMFHTIYLFLTNVVNDLSFSNFDAWASCIGLTFGLVNLFLVILCVVCVPLKSLQDSQSM